MKKVLPAIIAALFAAVTFNVAAQAPDSGSTSADTPKMEKRAKKQRKAKKPRKARKGADSAAPSAAPTDTK